MSSSEFFNSWDISINEEYKELYHSFFQTDYIRYFDRNEGVTAELFIDITKKSYSLLEKFIYDIAMFHFRRLNIEFDERKHAIEFWIPPRSHYPDSSVHIDCDEVYRRKFCKKKNPFLSTITYLSYDSEMKNPTMVTSIPHNSSSILSEYSVLQNNKFYFSFPKFLKHISFEGGKYYHGILDYFDCAKNNKNEQRIVLAIGLWDKEVNNSYVFPSKCNNLETKYLRTIPKDTSVVTLKKNKGTTKIIVCKEEGKKSNEFFELEKVTLIMIVRYTIYYFLNQDRFNYVMYGNSKGMLYFIEKIKENKEGDLYDNFGIHFI